MFHVFKRFKIISILASLFIFTIASVSFAEYKAGEILVRFKPGFTNDDTNRLFLKIGKGEPLKNISVIYVIKLKKGLTVEDAIKIAEKDSSVQIAEPNYIVRLRPKPRAQKSLPSTPGITPVSSTPVSTPGV